MKNILSVFRFDLRRAVSSVMAVIVLFGLVVIPSLFTWFNVIASWNPFDNTKNLTVAVASTDEGYQSDLVPIRLNVGEQVLSTMRLPLTIDAEKFGGDMAFALGMEIASGLVLLALVVGLGVAMWRRSRKAR